MRFAKPLRWGVVLTGIVISLFLPLAEFNAAYGIAFIVITVLIFARLLYRLFEFWFTKTPVDALLKRDLLLWTAVTYLIGTGIAVRLLTIGPEVTGSWGWVVSRAFLVIGAAAYWAWVEYHLSEA